jgi:competence ComEA-like helix-hairpin-helix protein
MRTRPMSSVARVAACLAALWLTEVLARDAVPVNLSTASLEELERLPEIGPTRAQAIIDGRPYAAPEDIMKVKGIKEGIYAKVKDFIVVR